MKIEQDIVQKVQEDFKKRQNDRKSFEAKWLLSMNFLVGNQYCSIGYSNDIEEYDKQYFWQEKEVYNHIAPTIEARLAKLQRVRPKMSVIPASGDESDIKTAKISKKIINTIYNRSEMSKLISQASKWSEVCGTSFYKISWNNNCGTLLSKGDENVHLGDVELMVCSPFEIFPDSNCNENIDDCQSIIHAKAYHVDEIEKLWGVKVVGEDVNVYSLENSSVGLGGLGYMASASKVISDTKQNHAVVIEKYEKPTKSYPNGRLVIVAGDKLLYCGELPYINRENGQRGFPFAKQHCISTTGCFWGTGIVERLIPIQRGYNAVKNRKHEFLNRISMGVLTVEDGSVDLENLEEEGLSPGKILVYRQGSNIPKFMSANSVPTDFAREEEALLSEFMVISGISDSLRSQTAYANMSGVALQLLIEQDDTRISCTTESIKEATKQVASQILRLYKQFAKVPRLFKIMGINGDMEVMYFSSSDISSDDVVFETDTELTESLAQRRSMVFELLNAGLLHDENGKLSNRMRLKALDLLGFGIWENAQDINELHSKKASSENIDISEGKKSRVLEIDNHDLHINEHIAYMLGADYAEKYSKNSEIENQF
ncbi:MAG: hypothetical protein IJA69_03330, partial [Clostridia bacterium]|nr:hypothetical protein [Clostridia bacterium]